MPSVSSEQITYSTHNLTKVYGEGESAVHALRGVNIEIPQGELVVLLGASGSGKSTLLNILGGLDLPSAGEVQFFGEVLQQLDEKQLTEYRREHVGFIFQFYNLMPNLTAYENVGLVTEIADDPLPPEEALSLVGLEQRMEHFPAQLSGGEQQRVAIARAIAKRPTVLFCDEPTGALDSVTGRQVLNVLQQINQRFNTTVLIITHAAATAAMANRVIHFADGNIRDIEINPNPVNADQIEW